MATKKEKFIDLTKDQVSPQVRVYVKEIEATYVSNLKNSAIPIFLDIAKTKNALAAYFMNRQLYKFLLGDNLGLLDRAFTSALATAITEDIHGNITSSKISYPGIWNHDDIYSIVASAITLMRSDNSDKIYLTGHQFAMISDEDLAKLDIDTYMEYSEYNPNRLYQMVIMIRNVAISAIIGIIKEKIPKAFIASDDMPIYKRMTDEIGKFMKDDFDAAKFNEFDITTPATERTINHFVEAFEKPFMVYYTEMIRESGLSRDAIVLMLNNTKINVIYNIDDRNCGAAELTYIFSAPDMKNPNGEVPSIKFVTTIKEMLDATYVGTDNMSVGAIERFGKKLRSLAINMCRYAVNIYINSIQESEPAFVTGMQITDIGMASALDGVNATLENM